MKKANEQTIKQAINLLLDTYKIKDKYLETSVIAHYDEIMGKLIASRTTEISVRQKKLYIRLSSAALKQELVQGKDKIIQLINEGIGAEVIKEVIFI